ncbi:duodenase-1 [Danio rerio]|uniref:trypsin n=1 Tax=Danio rerio TaxID=7955 RepID=A0A8M1RP83_DANRE|nr:duodenase-1 [Danio rerio]|eukprot:XP_003201096.2 duodenase-1 [Danio rerio]
MTIIIISLLLLVSLVPDLTYTAHVGIEDGTKAKPHSRPYMVSLQKNSRHSCGGFLITEQFVLTAAHCWKKGDVITVGVGAHDLSGNEIYDTFEVTSYIPHPEYKLNSDRNDIMLLKLNKKVRLSYNVGLISLPKDGEDVEADILCSVAGWGRLWLKGPSPDRLREAETVIVNDAECERRWNKTYKASKMICAYGHGGSCSGDSGGPLVCNNTAVGITSFSDRYLCNSRLLPNVYTRISAYLPWIHNITGNVYKKK